MSVKVTAISSRITFDFNLLQLIVGVFRFSIFLTFQWTGGLTNVSSGTYHQLKTKPHKNISHALNNVCLYLVFYKRIVKNDVIWLFTFRISVQLFHGKIPWKVATNLLMKRWYIQEIYVSWVTRIEHLPPRFSITLVRVWFPKNNGKYFVRLTFLYFKESGPSRRFVIIMPNSHLSLL